MDDFPRPLEVYVIMNSGNVLSRRLRLFVLAIFGGTIGSGSCVGFGVARQEACPEVIRTEAMAGEPFGVGMVSFRLPPKPVGAADPNMIIRTGAVQVSDKEHRVFYAAEGRPAAARFFRNVFGRSETPSDEIISVWFLFRGAEPLTLSVWGCDGITVQIEPAAGRQQKFSRLFKQWWREYQVTNFDDQSGGDFPDLVSVYLSEMLSHRFGLEHPPRRQPSTDPLVKTFELLTDIDPLSSTLIRQWFDGFQGFEVANQPLPPAIQWTPVVVNNLPADVPVEAIAHFVPDDCFYLRFGTWDNQIWLKRLIEEHGGDLTRMIRLRGFRAKVQSKFLNQLALESSQIDEWFGGNLIADVAVIGRDTYFDTGPSVGVMLHSKDTDNLKSRITARRKAFVADQDKQATLETIGLQGHEATFLSTPDNRYRSFHVVNGDMHLFTNSRAMAEAFLTCNANRRSLGDSAEFRYMRTQMPLERNDTMFIYLSTQFFQKLIEPQYQIELYRRGQSITEMQITQLAQLAGANEGFPNASTEFLIGGGYLPKVFAARPTGSSIDVSPTVWTDRDRGQRGFYIPIADVQVERASPSEVAWYQDRTRFFTENVQQLKPMVAAIQRFEGADNVERIAFDARVAPFGQEKYGWLTEMLGAPMELEVIGNEDDLVRLQMSVRGGVWKRDVPPHQLFAAIQGDVNPQIDLSPDSFFDAWRTLKQVPGYLGAWPKPGTLDWLPRLGGPPDSNGFTYSKMLDLWRLQFDEFSILGFDPDRLNALRGKLRVVPATSRAQLKLIVGDLSKANLEGWATVLNYRRAWEASIANTQLLNMMVEQFGVDPQSVLDVTEQLMDVKLTCSLGGEYELLQLPGRSVWTSTAWPNFSNPQIPNNYSAPVLNWFRGLELEISQVQNQYSIHGFLDMERSATTPGALPSIDIFKGFQNLFGKETGGGEK